MLIKALARITPKEYYHPEAGFIPEGSLFFVTSVSDMIEIILAKETDDPLPALRFIPDEDGECRTYGFKISFEQFQFFEVI